MSSDAPSDEVRRKWLKPAIGENFSLLNDVLASSFSTALELSSGGTFNILKQLDSYDDENFLLEHKTTMSAKTTKYLVKVHNGVESEDAKIIDYQNTIMTHLNSHPSINTTVPLISDDGAPFTSHQLPVASPKHSPAPLTVRLLTYIEGTPMAYKQVTPALLFSAGEYLANVDSSLDSFSHPASERFHAWDQKNTSSLREFVKYIQTPERQQLVGSVIDAFEESVLPDASSLRQGVLQSDFNDANIIIGASDKIAGVIDFGDSVKR
jgi:Ser/Thr protein kinase RdoA (MazF antagonist)